MFDFSQLPLRGASYADRISLLQKYGLLQGDAAEGFRLSGERTLLELGETTGIENCVGLMPIQVGLATNVRVNGVGMLVPLATEENGIVAGVSKAAKLCLPEGFSVETSAYSVMRGQVLFAGYHNQAEAADALNCITGGLDWAMKKALRVFARNQLTVNTQHAGLLTSVRHPSRPPKIVVNFTVDTNERMGAGLVTALAEKLATQLEPAAGRRRTSAICSNADAGWNAIVRTVWPKCQVSDASAALIIAQQEWAEDDECRAPTHNKGIMNAMSAVALATGQDTRAIETAAHICAMRQRGNYGPLTRYRIGRDGIEGSMIVRVPVGVRGGATENPFARMYLACTGIRSAHDLACVMAATGLAANFAALHCLACEGIPAAHERLRNG